MAAVVLMKVFGRTDANQKEVVKALRAFGCSVLILSSVGKGCPDLLAAKHGISILFEVKRSTKAHLTEDQEQFRAAWRGKWARVNSAIEAVQIMQGEIR